MRTVRNLEFYDGSREEKLPGYTADFPYIASRAELDCYGERCVPWHWHRAVELFYMESGELRYCTPGGTMVFPAGSGGMINSNVLHMTEIQGRGQENVQLLHIFDPELVAGRQGGAIDRKYVSPMTAGSRIEMILLSPGEPEQARILDMIRRAFQLKEEEFGYELKIREQLSGIWLRLLTMAGRQAVLRKGLGETDGAADRVKRMMAYIHEHYGEKISVSRLAEEGCVSERECYRIFQAYLHTTPNEYMRSCRLQMACRRLAEGKEPVTEVGHACGMGDASYFGKVFREHTGCTPLQYRQRRQDIHKN